MCILLLLLRYIGWYKIARPNSRPDIWASILPPYRYKIDRSTLGTSLWHPRWKMAESLPQTSWTNQVEDEEGNSRIGRVESVKEGIWGRGCSIGLYDRCFLGRKFFFFPHQALTWCVRLEESWSIFRFTSSIRLVPSIELHRLSSMELVYGSKEMQKEYQQSYSGSSWPNLTIPLYDSD